MAGDINNPRIWINAKAYVADLLTSGPTDVTSPWPDDWEDLGLLSEVGSTEDRTETITDQWAWGSILVRTTRSKHKRSMKVTALEDNPFVFGLVNPGAVVSTALGVTKRAVYVPTTDRRTFGLERVDGLVTARRVIPTGEVTGVASIVSSDSAMTAYELTITVYPDATGLLWDDYTNDPQAALGS